MTTTSYEDWIPLTPDPASPTFQTQVAVQFMDNAGQAVEAAPSEPGQLFKYQIFDKEFLRIYDRLLMFYEAGTGKTCAYLSVAEDFRSAATKSRIGVLTDALVAYQHAYQGIIKRVYVLLKGNTLVEEFRKQLVCKCTGGTYLTPKVVNAKTVRAQRMNLSYEINKWYTVETYIKFYNKIARSKMDRAALAKEFEGCLFIMDEIHALQAGELFADKEDRTRLTDEDKAALEDVVEGDEEMPQRRPMTLFSRVYQTIWDVVHAPRWCKVILATATPMINSSADLIDPMNLLLPADRQLPRNAPLRSWTLAQFRDAFSGYISYVRAGDTGVDAVYQGTPLTPESKMLVERVVMRPRQAKVYLEVVAQQKRGVRNDERQASNFVFPDGSYGGMLERQLRRGGAVKGMGVYVRSTEIDTYSRSEKWLKSIKTLEDVRECSNLYATIIESVKASLGLCFVYQELFTGSGAIVLAMCMETLGFKRFKPAGSVFQRTATSGLKPLCAEEGTRTLTGLQPALRYGMITSETNEDTDQYLLELFNSRENATGAYVKVLIGSRVVRDGINLANVVDVYLPAMWTPSGMYQAMQRAIRATSHVDMVRRSPTGRVDVRIHRMASVAPVTGQSASYSVDLDMYKIIEEKDKEIAKVRRAVKQVAVDCWLHYARNVREGGEDYSPECDYDLCTYVCVDPQPTDEDVNRYTVPAFANQDQVASLVTEVFPQMFSYMSDIPLDTMVRWLDQYAKWSEVYAALLHCQHQRVLFMDRYGQLSEVRLVEDRVVLVPPATPVGHSEWGVFYRSGLISVKTQTFRSYVSQAGTEAAQEGGLVEAEAAVLEAAVLAGRVVPSKSVNFYYEFKLPQAELAVERSKYDPSGPARRGRKPTKAVLRDKPLGVEAEEGPEVVRVHTLYTIPAKIESANAVSMYESLTGRIRILDEGSTTWRDASMAETVVYTALVQGRIRRQLETYERTGLYGSVYGDNVFRIRDMRKERPEGITDRRKLSRGVKCDSSGFSEETLTEYIRELGGTVPPVGSRHSEYCSAMYNALKAAGRLFVLRPE
jgi:hypothetical protein